MKWVSCRRRLKELRAFRDGRSDSRHQIKGPFIYTDAAAF